MDEKTLDTILGTILVLSTDCEFEILEIAEDHVLWVLDGDKLKTFLLGGHVITGIAD